MERERLDAVAERIVPGKGIGQRDDRLPFVEEPLGDVLARIAVGSRHGMDRRLGHFAAPFARFVRTGEAGLRSRRVQIRVLAHLPLHLLAFFLEVHQRPALAEMAALDLPLRLAEEPAQAIERAGRPSRPRPSSLSRLLRSQPGQEQVVVQGQVLAVRARVALAAATAAKLAVDAARRRAFPCR